MATVMSPVTTEELLALPEEGVDRWLIAGELRERSMTTRNRFHSGVMSRMAQALTNWLDQQPEPRGQVLTGDAGVRLARNPDTTFGVDLVFISAEVLARQTPGTAWIDGIPTLAVEILSPSDTVEDIHEKVTAYKQAGVPLVWIVDPYDRTVTVHRPHAEPELFNVKQNLGNIPQLPGFDVCVRAFFE